MLKSAIAVIAGIVMSASACAQGAIEMLEAFSKNVQSARGAYTQTGYDKNEKAKMPVTQGNFAFKRPGLFYWNTAEPFVQKIVCDASKLWLYDPDLAQVTVRNVKGVLGATPAAILFGNATLSTAFVLKELPEKNTLKWVNATPKTEDSSCKSIDIAFNHSGELSILVLHDHFGEKTEYKFSKFERNPKLDTKEFTFDIPKGTDVLEDNSQVF